jgi:hypothetical protein
LERVGVRVGVRVGEAVTEKVGVTELDLERDGVMDGDKEVLGVLLGVTLTGGVTLPVTDAVGVMLGGTRLAVTLMDAEKETVGVRVGDGVRETLAVLLLDGVCDAVLEPDTVAVGVGEAAKAAGLAAGATEIEGVVDGWATANDSASATSTMTFKTESMDAECV